MTERNRHVPYPSKEILVPVGVYMEQSILGMAEGKLPSYSTLPSAFRSTQTEAYANWFSDLTQADPLKQERGAVPHVKSATKEIIFPSNPDVGKDSVRWAVSKNRDKFTPTINVHSHPATHALSGYDGDLGTLIGGWGENDDYFHPTGMLATGPLFNYYMQRTQETPLEKDPMEIYKTGYQHSGYDQFLEVRRYGTELGRELDTRRYWDIFELAEAKFFYPSFEGFYRSIFDSLDVAEVYKLGFYVSRRDGNYVRLTKDVTIPHITEALDIALTSALKK